MTTPQHRQHSPDPDHVAVRDTTDQSDDDGLFRIRMPVTSTQEARDGEAFGRSKVRGFRDQIDAGRVPVFLDHGRNAQTGAHYSALGKVGYLDAPELVERDGGTDLDADFVLVDPAELDTDEVGAVREALAWVREQARLGLPLASSVGWSDDVGERDVPGDADLLETSIVGIPSDPRTTTAAVSAEPAALARAVSAATPTDAGALDPDAFAAAYREAITEATVDEATPTAVDGHTPETTGARNLDDPAFGPGDAVMWSFQGEPVHGRVNDVHEQFTPPGIDDPITGDEGEAVYSIFEYDEQTESFADVPNVAKPESALDESTMDLPALGDDGGEDGETETETASMADDDSTGDDAGTTDDRTERLRAMEEEMAELREQMEENTQMTREIHGEMMGDGDGENANGDDDAEGDGDEDDEDEGGENSTDAGAERTVTIDGEERTADEAVAHLRNALDATSLNDLDSQTSAGAPDDAVDDDRDGDSNDSDDDTTTFGFN